MADTAMAASAATLGHRAGVDEDIATACLDALVESKVVIRLNAVPDHPLYILPAYAAPPVVRSPNALASQAVGVTADVGADSSGGDGASAAGGVEGSRRVSVVPRDCAEAAVP